MSTYLPWVGITLTLTLPCPAPHLGAKCGLPGGGVNRGRGWTRERRRYFKFNCYYVFYSAWGKIIFPASTGYFLTFVAIFRPGTRLWATHRASPLDDLWTIFARFAPSPLPHPQPWHSPGGGQVALFALWHSCSNGTHTWPGRRG